MIRREMPDWRSMTMYNYRSRMSAPTTLGIDERIERVLCYALGWITGLIFLVIEQRNATVRRHAWQSVVVFGTLNLATFVLGILSHIFIIGLLFGVLGWIVGVVSFVLWIVLMIFAFVSPATFIGDSQRYA
jgi:uncharacterized membrane protein